MKTIFVKTFLILFAMTFGLTTANAQSAEPVSTPKPIMTWDKKFVDFGEITKGEKRTTTYHFTNTGDVPLEIDLVSACECTTTEYPRGEIAPGESGTIDIVFDSTEKEESETVDIDIFLKDEDPETGAPLIEMLQFKFILIE